MIATGTVLKFPAAFKFADIDFVRLIHSNTALLFAPVLLFMMATGGYMYFYPWLSRIKIGEKKMNTWTISFQSKKEVAAETVEFSFTKPAGFIYTAGQYLVWNLISPPETDAEGSERPFTISSAPFENKLSFTTRIRDTAFKRVVGKMKPGDTISVSGPEGDLILPEDPKTPVVFLAGGIGVTPFRSIIAQAAADKLPHKIFLFYSDKTPEDAACLAELAGLQKKNRHFKLIAAMTRPEEAKVKWHGETGRINPDLLKKYLGKNLNSYLYFIAGPPAMVESLRQVLFDAKVSPERVMSENFTGY